MIHGEGVADILLAEDNPSDAELILQVLEEVAPLSGVHRVQDGVEALEYLRSRSGSGSKGRPRLILLDVKMPRVGGMEVLEAIRADPVFRYVPVVMLTSSNIESDVAEAYLLGANAYVQKPVDFMRFRDVVRLMGRFWAEVNQAPSAGRRSET